MKDYHLNISNFYPLDYEYENINTNFILLYFLLTIKIILILIIVFLYERIVENVYKNNNKKRKRIDEKYETNKRRKIISNNNIKKCYFCNENIVSIVSNIKNKKLMCKLCYNKSYVVKKLTDDILETILSDQRSAKKVELIKSKILKLKKLRL
jgi:hypothetical protein